jgi:hypothetical protein
MKRQKTKKGLRKTIGGSSYVAANAASVESSSAPLESIGRTISFNTNTGAVGVDPLAPINIIDSRLLPQQSGGKRKRTRSAKKRNRRTRRRKIRGGLGWSSLDAVPDLFLGQRTNMNQISAFGSTAGGIQYNQNQLTGKGNLDGPSLIPNMGPPSRAMA